MKETYRGTDKQKDGQTDRDRETTGWKQIETKRRR